MKVHVPVVRCKKCSTPWVLRWSFSLEGRPEEYLFQADCKCKPREYVVNNEIALLSGVAR